MIAPKHVVIAGAGIHGLSTAYFLSQKGVQVTLLERTGTIAPGASSKAAGFLTKDWNDDTPSEELTRRSFELHQQFADKFGADTIDYRRLQCVAVKILEDIQKEVKRKKSKHSIKPKVLEWRPQTQAVHHVYDMGDESTIAQVHPGKLCQALWKACQETGLVEMKKGRVIGAKHSEKGLMSKGKLEGALCEDGALVEADALLYAAGAWTANIMYGIKGHSLILPTSRVLKQTIFFESQSHGEPEVFVRPDQTAFVSGYPGDLVKVKEVAGQETIEQNTVDRLVKSVRVCMGYPLRDSEDNDNDSAEAIAVGKDPVKVQTCYQPCTDDFLPIMGKLNERSAGGDNVYIQGGHNCWGILLAPASGEAMADLIMTGQSKEVDLSPFRPNRYRNLKPVPVDDGDK